MMQRVQTIFMLIATIAMVSMVFFPLWEKSDSKSGVAVREYIVMNAFEVRYEKHNNETGKVELSRSESVLVISIVAFLAATVMLISVFEYKNRLKQIKLNALFSLITSATVVGIIYFALKSNDWVEPERPGTYLMGFYLPIVAMFCNFLANRFIRKDEKLVRSMDRIR